MGCVRISNRYVRPITNTQVEVTPSEASKAMTSSTTSFTDEVTSQTDEPVKNGVAH